MAPVSTRASMMWLVWTMMALLSSALHGCDSPAQTQIVNGGVTNATIAGKVFKLEVAADMPTRMRGLGGRKEIAADGGMIFTFPRSQWGPMAFVMRDCPIDIDILYLDGAGRVLTTYTMKAQPRGPEDGMEGDWNIEAITDPKRKEAAQSYEKKLKQYPSRFVTSFVIELKPGTIQKLGVKEGDKVQFDIEGLKAAAK